MPEGFLNTAVDRLIKDVSTKVLHKRKRMLKPGDNVTVDGGVDIFCSELISSDSEPKGCRVIIYSLSC